MTNRIYIGKLKGKRMMEEGIMKWSSRYSICLVFAILGVSLILSSPDANASRSDVEAFVTRFYQQCLGRNPDALGLEGWVNALINGTLTGSDVAYGFIFSDEFIS